MLHTQMQVTKAKSAQEANGPIQSGLAVATAVKVAQTLKAQMSMVKKKFLGIMIGVHHTVREKKKDLRFHSKPYGDD